MKLNKTETKLLALLAQKGRICVGTTIGRGADGGKVSGGLRDTHAALKLEERGLLKRVSYDTYRHYNNGWCIHCSDIVYVAPETNQ